jgi:hypothetical protein
MLTWADPPRASLDTVKYDPLTPTDGLFHLRLHLVDQSLVMGVNSINVPQIDRFLSGSQVSLGLFARRHRDAAFRARLALGLDYGRPDVIVIISALALLGLFGIRPNAGQARASRRDPG